MVETVPRFQNADAANGKRLILASGSAVRARLLIAAGLDPMIDPADINEPVIEAKCRADGLDTPETALCLALKKAHVVSARHPGHLVVGADQMLELADQTLAHPRSMADAARTLAQLSGRDHELVSAVCLVRDGRDVWCHTARARLTMRSLDKTAIDGYLAVAGPAILSSVGAYHLEGLGSQLFTKVEGDYFTILGLPLLALLAALRDGADETAGLLT